MLLLLLVAVLTALDLAQPPARQVSGRLLITAIRCYQITAAPCLAALGVDCRFEPSCSRYAADVLCHRGVVYGGWLTLRRLARCGPWTANGTVDPPPPGPGSP